MLEIADQNLNNVKKVVIDAVISNPDLDVAALNYHLQNVGMSSVVEDVTGEEMKSRLPFDPNAIGSDSAAAQLEELLGLVSGKSGLFSKTYTPRV